MSADALPLASPHWMVRWGNLVLLCGVAAVLAAAAVVPYPDAIQGSATIAADPPPTAAVSRMAGVLTILVKDGHAVAANEALAVVETTARLADVRALRQLLGDRAELHALYPPLRVGELQPHYAAFLDAMHRWRDILHDPQSTGGEMELSLQIDYAERQLLADRASIDSIEAKAGLTRSSYDRTRSLFGERLVAEQEVERAEAALLDARGAVENGRAAKAMSETRVTRYRQALADFRHSRALQLEQRSRAAEEARQNLLAQLDQWEALHVIEAPRAGRVWLLPAAVDRQHVGAEQPLMLVLPEQWKAMARVDVPLHRAGDVQAGQEVSVELAEYPAADVPPLRGRVLRIAPMPREGGYAVDVALSAHPSPLKPGMTGRARIATRDRSILGRLLVRLFREESS
ncbi:MAG TPA: HlyD family efflux transporter periplasmic adaptor subunit [Thermoanaerobaculia bacterium]|nr:HlyD family efflux transporter periplasmic adaptor subunit [Thermoanaerobaculia bacterium]